MISDIMGPIVQITEDLANDALIVQKIDELGIKTRRSILRNSTADNDINTLYGINSRYRAGYAATNAYRAPKVFPRSEQDKDAIMIRRVNARLRLKQQKHWRRLKVAGIAVAAGWLFPVLCAIIARTWTACMFWIAS